MCLFEPEAHCPDGAGEGVGAIVEFLLEDSVSALDATVIFRLAGRQDDEREVQALIGLRELGHECGTAIH